MKTFFKPLFYFIFISFLIHISCSKDDDINSENNDTDIIDTADNTGGSDTINIYPIPEKTNDGWETASLISVDMEESLLLNLLDSIDNSKYPEVHSVVIIRNGKLVFEEYYSGHDFYYQDDDFHGDLIDFNRKTLHNTHSATKSIVSALIGIAIHEGFINNINDSIFNIFTYYYYLKNNDNKDITIKHLLTMSSGFDWNEWTVPPGDPNYDTYLFNTSYDPIRYILSKPVVAEPGTLFNYNGATVDLLGEIIRLTSEIKLDQFSETYLFGPINIEDYQWQTLPQGIVVAHGDIYMRPRDMAKFGYLYLNNGKWNGQQIIPWEWVKNSIQAQIELPQLNWADNYGYLWWMKDYIHNNQIYSSFKAIGWGGQEIYAFPALDLVVVFTGANYKTHPPCDEIVLNYILPSIKEMH
jgi:CubicO group peptidase (beta-lactamase class C family)